MKMSLEIEGIPFAREARVLEVHECGLMAVEKPVNIKSHPNKERERKGCLVLADYDEKEEAYLLEDGRKLHLLNRLDSPTSGIVLMSLRDDASEAVRDAFRERAIKKEYIALTFGAPSSKRIEWSDRLKRGRDEGGHLRVARGGDKEAKTKVTVLATERRLSLLKFEPLSGKTHQLRVQAALRNCPIVGDKTYGKFRENKDFKKAKKEKRMFLHAHKIRLAIEVGGEAVTFEAESPVPESFREVMR